MTLRFRSRSPAPLGWLAGLAFAILAGELWPASAEEPIERAASEALGALPATFAGTLPCADCPGIRYQLDLYPDRVFFLRTTYLDRAPDNVFDAIGSFRVSTNGRTLALRGGGEAPFRFRVVSAGRLTMLDASGGAIPSALNYDLTRQATFAALEPRLAMRGMYRYMADAGLFTECLTRRRLPVAQEADNAALERAYGKARRQPGEELLVELEGQIARRPKIEGQGYELALVPLRFIGVWPGETCGTRFDSAPLENGG
jgi:copper homeostasis protein (lipoprotein)